MKKAIVYINQFFGQLGGEHIQLFVVTTSWVQIQKKQLRLSWIC